MRGVHRGVRGVRGRAVQVDCIKTSVETSARPWSQRLMVQYDEPLSKCGFKFNWRRYSEDDSDEHASTQGEMVYTGSAGQRAPPGSINSRNTSVHRKLITCQHSASQTCIILLPSPCAHSVPVHTRCRLLPGLATRSLTVRSWCAGTHSPPPPPRPGHPLPDCALIVYRYTLAASSSLTVRS